MSRETLEYWQRRMRSASSEEALLAIVAEYLGTFPSEQVASLPESSRPLKVTHAEEIAALNVQIARDELMYTGDADVARLLRQLVAVLTEATNRLGQFSLEARLLRPPQ